MAKRRKPVRSKAPVNDENEPTKVGSIKRPRRAAALKNKAISPVEEIEDKNGAIDGKIEHEESAQRTAELESDHQTVNNEQPTERVECKTDGSEQVSEASDSSSDSESSSDSDSDSSDSDSKSGTKEETTVAPPEVPAIQTDNISKDYSGAKSSSSDSYHSDTEEEDKKRRKKQKNLQKQLLNKKPRRSASGRSLRADLADFEKDDDDDIAVSQCDDMPDWPEADFGELLRRIEEQLPAKDSLKFDSRAAKLDWNLVRFKHYSAEECFDVWCRISKRIRRFRTLSEMLSDAREWITKPWTNFYRGTKKNRHPDMPSRPLSTYMIYYLEQKDRVAAENPGMEMTQVSKIISEQYKALTDVEKDKYMELAAKERQSFEEKLSDFYKEHPEMIPSTQPKTNSRDNNKGPRKPNAPFKLFYQEQLKRFAADGVYDRKGIEDMAKEKWRAMSDKKKLVWITWSLEDLKRYEGELRAYLLEHPDYVPPVAAKNVLNKDERAIKERLAGKPLKPPNSAYSYFSRVMLQSDEDVKSIPPKLRMAEISRKWREISDAQKTRYEEKVRELQEQYKLEFASYLEGLTGEEREEELKKMQPKRKVAAAKVDVEKVEPPPRRMPARAASRAPPRATAALNLYKGEPAPPPVRAFDLFLTSFLAERPAGTTEAQRIKEAPRYWEVLAEAKKETYRKTLAELKQQYIKDYEAFLKGLSPEELKEFSLLKAKSKRLEEQRELRRGTNKVNSDSNEDTDSERNESSSGSDSDSKSSSSSASDG